MMSSLQNIYDSYNKVSAVLTSLARFLSSGERVQGVRRLPNLRARPAAEQDLVQGVRGRFYLGARPAAEKVQGVYGHEAP